MSKPTRFKQNMVEKPDIYGKEIKIRFANIYIIRTMKNIVQRI
jgi:hypothetical protein